MASRLPNPRDIFLGALDTPSEAERAAFLDRECGGDASLRAAVEELLRGVSSVGDFLEFPAVAPVSRLSDDRKAVGTEAVVVGKPGHTIGPYKLLQELGAGGCGIVYMAEQQRPVRRRVALKIIKLGMDTRQVVARFEAERQALAMMDHPNIAKVLDAGATDNGRPYFVMELVRGIKITDYCDQHNLPTAGRLRLFIQVCNAIQHAHQKGIVHRDIKPSNILVTLHDGTPVPKVIDFGVAKAVNQQRLTDLTVFTAFEQFIGTPAYMSPEQAEMSGLDIDTRSDIYSLGVLLYELLTGKTPFDAEALARGGLDQCRKTIRLSEPARPSNRLATMLKADLAAVAQQRGTESPRLIHLLRGDLDWIVMKCLEKDRTRRYAAANSLAVEVERYLQGDAVEARPPTSWYRLQKFARRHRGPLAATVALVLVLLAGIVVSAFQAVRARRAEETAQKSQMQEALLRRQAEIGLQRAREKGDLARLNEYVADINLAHQALEAGNFGRAAQLLGKHVPQSGESDLRGFEWRYLSDLCRGDTHVAWPDQEGSIQGLSFSPNGEWLALVLRDRVSVYETRNRLRIATLVGMFASAIFSPDSKFLYTGSHGQGPGRGGPPQGGGIRVFGTRNWEETASLPRTSAPMALSSDGRYLACQAGGGIRLYRVPSWETVGRLPGTSVPFAFSPDGAHLAADSQAGVALWSTETFQPEVVLQGATNFVTRGGGWFRSGRILTYSSDGRHVFAVRNYQAGGAPFVLGVWDARSGELVETMPRNPEHIEHTGFITGISLSPDGNALASASMDHSIKIWDVPTGRVQNTFHGHVTEAWAVAFSPDGQSVASGGKDGSVKLWPARGAPRSDTIRESLEPVAFSKNGRSLVGVDPQTRRLVFLSVASREREKELELQEQRFRFFEGVSVSADFTLVAEALGDGRVKLTNLQTMEANYLSVSEGPVGMAALSPDGRSLITGGFGQPLRWWKLSDGSSMPMEAEAFRVIFSPTGSVVALLGRSNIIEVWEAASRALRAKISLESSSCFVAAFAPDGQTLATAASPEDPDQSVYLWDTHSGKALGRFAGHKQAVFAVTFSPDGKTLATGSDDSTIKLWNVASRQELLTIPHAEGGGGVLLFAPDGRLLVSAARAGSPNAGLRLYRAPLPQDAAQGGAR